MRFLDIINENTDLGRQLTCSEEELARKIQIEAGPAVVSSAIVVRNGHLLVGKKLTGPCKGQFVPPGGRVHLGECLETAARRELAEETGLIAQSGMLVDLAEVIDNNLHIVHAHVVCDILSHVVPHNNDSENIEEWIWIPRHNLRDQRLAESLEQYLKKVGWI